jgi:hypothetical protein
MSTRYRDVSHDPRAPERAEDTLGAAERLRQAGFTTAGWVEDRLAGAGRVYEVLASPDRAALALPENLFGQPHVAFRTLLDDGTIVETAFARRGGIRLLPPPRVHHPWAGYELRRAPADVDRAFDAHRRHVEEVARRRGTAARPQDDLALYVAMGERTTRQLRVRQAVNAVALVAVAVAGQGVPALLGPEGLALPAWAGAPLLAGLILGVLWLAPGRWVPLPRVPRAALARETEGDETEDDETEDDETEEAA